MSTPVGQPTIWDKLQRIDRRILYVILLLVVAYPTLVPITVPSPVTALSEGLWDAIDKTPKDKVLILSSYSDDEYVRQLSDAGASGYLIKQTAANDLLRAIREVKQGNAFFSPAISKRLLEQYRQAFVQGEPGRKTGERLTSRENEVLQLIAESMATKQIAAELNLSIKTVEKHRQDLMNKLNIHNIAGLTRYAISNGAIECSAKAQTLP